MKVARAQFLRGVGLVVLAAVSWGCWSLFLKPAAVPAALAAPVVMTVMGLTLLPLRARDGIAPRWDRSTLAMLVGLAACDALNMATFFAAMDVTTVGIAVLSHYLTPLIVALLAPFLDGERVAGSRWAALLGTAGLALVLEPWRASGSAAWGATLGGISALGYAGNLFLTARLLPRIGPARTVGYHAFLSALMLLPFVPAAAWGSASRGGIALVVAGGITLGALSGWLFSRGLAVIGPTLASTLAFLEPLTGVIVGWVAWGERLSALALIGAGMILGSGAWVTRARARGR